MRDTFQHFISALLLTPHWSHYLLASAPWLLASWFLWRKWPSMRSLIDKRRSELKHFGELPPGTKWAEWKKLCADISGGARKHTRTVINVAAGILVGIVLGWYAHVWKIHAEYAQELADWQKSFAVWKARQHPKGEHYDPVSYAAGRPASTASSASAP